MKRIIYPILFFGLLFNLSAQTIEISPSDTSYFYDASNLKLKSDISNGEYLIYYDEVKINLAIKGRIVNQKRDSIWIWYYENGMKKREATYEKGTPSGKLKEFYSNGNPKRSCIMKDGFPHGMYTEWYEGGLKKEEGEFIDGSRSGNWKFWDSNGNLINEILFEKGIEVEKD